MSRKTLIFSGSTIIITILIAVLYLPQRVKQTNVPTALPIQTPRPKDDQPLAETPTPEPKSALELAWDRQKQTDLLNLVNATYLYSIESAKLPENFPTTPTCVGKAKDCFDLTFLVPNQISEIPKDPQIGDENNTGYYIYFDSGRLTASDSAGVTVRK